MSLKTVVNNCRPMLRNMEADVLNIEYHWQLWIVMVFSRSNYVQHSDLQYGILVNMINYKPLTKLLGNTLKNLSSIISNLFLQYVFVHIFIWLVCLYLLCFSILTLNLEKLKRALKTSTYCQWYLLHWSKASVYILNDEKDIR